MTCNQLKKHYLVCYDPFRTDGAPYALLPEKSPEHKDTRMEQDHQILFRPFRFDRTLRRLWQGSRAIRIRSKTWR